MNQNLRAFLDMLAVSEIGRALMAVTDDGYRCIVGSTVDNPILIEDYADHPRRLIEIRPGLKSTAAGRYQLLGRYFDPYKKLLHLQDFSPESQDLIAIRQIIECKALVHIEAGDFDGAVAKCAHIWASLPGAGYQQHENSLDHLRTAYVDAGGRLA